MDDLIAFLNARLDEDEARARAFTPSEWMICENGELDYTVAPVHTETLGEAIADTWREDVASWVVRHDPARVIREVAAKRVITELHDRVHTCPVIVPTNDPGAFEGNLGYVSDEYVDGEDPEVSPCTTLRALAAVWSDHPDYLAEWKPS